MAERPNPHHSFKTEIDPSQLEALDLGETNILPLGEVVPDPHLGQGAIVTNGRLANRDQPIIKANILPGPWRLDNPQRKEAVPGDLILYNLKPECQIEPTPLPVSQTRVGLELEAQLVRKNNSPGDVTVIDGQNLVQSGIKIEPEIRRDGMELAYPPVPGSYKAILNIFKSGLRTALLESEKKDQFLIPTGACPFDQLSGRHPHPYLEAAEAVVALNNLALKPENPFYQRFVAHLFPPGWHPDQGMEAKRLGVQQFSALGLQVNIEIPHQSEELATWAGNYLMLSPVSLIKGALLFSTPFLNGVYSGRLDIRTQSKREVLTTAGYQEPFLPLEQDLARINRAVIEGRVPTIARGYCRGGGDGNCRFHGQGRVRSDRENPTFEDMIPSSHPLDTLTAAYAWLKACDMVYLTYCYSNNLQPDSRFYQLLDEESYLNLQEELELNGPQQYKQNLREYLVFMEKFLTTHGLMADTDQQAFTVVENALQQPDQYGVAHYLDPQSPSFAKGTLSEHLIADLKDQTGAEELPLNYQPELAQAIYRVMTERYYPALMNYYLSYPENLPEDSTSKNQPDIS